MVGRRSPDHFVRPFFVMHLTSLPGSRSRLVRFAGIALCLGATCSSLPATPGVVRNAPVLRSGQTLADLDYNSPATPPRHNLADKLEYPAAADDYARISTPLGDIYVQFLTADAPLTVANFKSYLATDSTPAANLAKTYDGTFIHRAIPGFIVQGGGYRPVAGLPPLEKRDPVQNEFKAANTRGTLAMAKSPPPPGQEPDDASINSATTEWFFNLADNRENLDNQNGGFTAFARVLGNGMRIVDTIANLNQLDLNGPATTDAFDNLPYYNVQRGQTELQFFNLLPINTLRAIPASAVPAELRKTPVIKYTVLSNTRPAAAKATISKGSLVVSPGKNGGQTTVTLRASVGNNIHSDFTFQVTKDGPPVVVRQLPATITAALGTTPVLAANVTAWPLNIRWQFRASATDPWVDISSDDTRFTGVATETLAIKLAGATPAAVGQALALANNQFRFVVTNDHGGVPRVAEGKPTTLRITTRLSFSGKLAKTTTAALGSTLTLSAPATADSYPAVSYRWERRAPGDTAWTALVNSAAAVKGNGTNENPQFPAVASPFTGVTTSTLTIRLNGTTPAASASSIDTLTALALNQNQFRCVLHHDRGAGPVETEGVPTTLRITTLPVEIANHPAPAFTGSVDSSTPARISVSARPAAVNTPVSYQWQARAPGSAVDAWQNLADHVADDEDSPGVPSPYSGTKTTTLSVRLDRDPLSPGFGLALEGYQYRCLVSNILKNAPAPVGPTGIAISNTSTLRVLARRISLVTAETFPLPGLEAAPPGRIFTAKGLPKGLVIDDETGHLSGTPSAKPGVYEVTVTLQGAGLAAELRTYYIEVLSLRGNNVGGFEGLLSSADSPPAAKLNLTVSANGAFTGTVTTAEEKKPLPFRGSLTRSPSGVLSLPPVITLPRPGTPKGRVYLLTDVTIGANGTLSATLSTQETPDAAVLEIGSTETGVRLANYSKTNAAPWTDMLVYNVAFTRPALLAPPAGDSASAIPVGSGYARAPIGADGRLNLVGKLPDGAPLTASLPTAGDASYRLFARPYAAAPQAFVSADFKLAATQVKNASGATFPRYALAADAGEDVFWRRPANIKKPATYPSGFGPLGLTLDVQPWLFFNGTNIGLKFGANNATIGIALNGPVLDNAEPNPRGLPSNLVINFTGFRLTDAAPPDSSNLNIKLVEKTGAFSGTLVLADKRKVAVEGIFLVPTNVNNTTLPNGTVTAEGFALIPPAPGATDTGYTTERIRLHQQGAVPAP